MATSKTLTPTNVTIQIPEFTDQPDQRVNSNCIDKEADAINALNGQISELNAVRQKVYSIPTTGKTILFSGASNGFVYIQVANNVNQFGLYMYYGSSANCYVREIVGSSYVTVAATTGGLVFTNTSSGARTIRLLAINGYDNLPDS